MDVLVLDKTDVIWSSGGRFVLLNFNRFFADNNENPIMSVLVRIKTHTQSVFLHFYSGIVQLKFL